MSERQDNLEKFNREKKEPEISLENAELCDSIADLWATEDKETIFWKKKGLEIREKYYGKKNLKLATYYDDIANEHLECTNYKSSLNMCKKALKIKEQNNCNFEDVIKTYAIMMEDYSFLEDYENGIKCGVRILNTENITGVLQEISEDLSKVIVLLSRMYIRCGSKKEAEYWLNYGLNLAIETLGEDSVMAADMFALKATSFSESKEEKLELLKKALEIYIESFGMQSTKSEKAFLWIWHCWDKETKKPISMALEWLEKNIDTNYFDKIREWRKNKFNDINLYIN